VSCSKDRNFRGLENNVKRIRQLLARPQRTMRGRRLFERSLWKSSPNRSPVKLLEKLGQEAEENLSSGPGRQRFPLGDGIRGQRI